MKRMTKREADRVFRGIAGQFDVVEDFLKMMCHAIYFIQSKELFKEFLRYMEDEE